MRIHKNESIGLIIDIQERLLPHINQHAELIRNTMILIEGLKVLGIPIITTEQYPKGLGNTIEQVKLCIEEFNPIEKIAFSCCDEPAFRSTLGKSEKKSIIICGIETHVCVLQTVLDLISDNYLPVVVLDCVSSRKQYDKELAVRRMEAEGAIITSYESILFELARFAGNDIFKSISTLVK